ncbi:hypothetical protein DPMN_171368 [Dreissena polymorpha]|uniref:Hexosyltransferase n=1 Tax=Dreissena polymorpha TaxID=45954 RepID=A0A9D4IFI1_DREPO|nr:hypothetical protein DPMN_171368 [Dreissena polymorpha]
MLVFSVHARIDLRAAIRNTWGSEVENGSWPGNGSIGRSVKLLFLFGRSDSSLGNTVIREESALYGDIVQGDFRESYYNLTLKSVMGIRWVALYCPKAKFILRADDDVFIDVKNLIYFLEIDNNRPQEAIYGRELKKDVVRRTGRCAVDKAAFSLNEYPTYVPGNSFVLSGRIYARIDCTAGVLPCIHIEDAFVTAIIGKILGIKIVNDVGFTHWYETQPKPVNSTTRFAFPPRTSPRGFSTSCGWLEEEYNGLLYHTQRRVRSDVVGKYWVPEQ